MIQKLLIMMRAPKAYVGMLEQNLGHYGITAKVKAVRPGPIVTLLIDLWLAQGCNYQYYQ